MTTNTRLRKTMLTLPPEVAEAFAGIRDTETRNDYIIALRAGGWTLQSIAEASQITRERVRQIATGPDTGSDIADLPQPTPPSVTVKPKREYNEPRPEVLKRLLELQPLAQQVRSDSPKYREEGEEYTKLLYDSHVRDNVPIYRLAKRLGITHGAIRFRLVRYQYMVPKKNGTSKVYTPVKEINRVDLPS